MGFYIIEINDKYKQVVLLSADGELYCKDVAGLMPYTEPDLEQVREEAYQRGYCDALEKHCEICEEKHDAEETYQQGLNDAWECARKIGSNSMCSLKEMGFDFSQCVVSDYNPSWFVVKNYSAPETIEKIRQYEQEKEAENGEFIHCPKCGHKSCASDVWDNCEGMFCPNCGTNLKVVENKGAE